MRPRQLLNCAPTAPRNGGRLRYHGTIEKGRPQVPPAKGGLMPDIQLRFHQDVLVLSAPPEGALRRIGLEDARWRTLISWK